MRPCVSHLHTSQACVDGVQAAIAASDYATGAGHVHRYLQFSKSLLASEAAAESGPACHRPRRYCIVLPVSVYGLIFFTTRNYCRFLPDF